MRLNASEISLGASEMILKNMKFWSLKHDTYSDSARIDLFIFIVLWKKYPFRLAKLFNFMENKKFPLTLYCQTTLD